MKKIIRLSIILLLAIVINMFVPFASPASAIADEVDISKYGIDPNILVGLHLMLGFDGSGAGIVDQYWYTKLIKLEGYNKKDVSGILHYEIVPDYDITSPIIYDVKGTSENSKVKVTIRRGGVRKFTYDVPFSSNDFVDPKFNELCAKAGTKFGLDFVNSFSNKPIEYGKDKAKAYVELFNHAFLNEWGTVITREEKDYIQDSENQKIYRVGKISQSHFSNLQNYLNYVKQMRNNNLLIKWKGDPETFVTGYGSDWNNTEYPYDEANINRPLRSSTANEKLLADTNEEHLSTYESFRNGKMKFTSFHTIPEYLKNSASGESFYDRLYTITRPIAISKKYDSNGNITLLEKPLFPSESMATFLADNASHYENYDSYSSDKHLDVYRYILREKQPTGVTLKCGYEPYVLDVVRSTVYPRKGKIYIYKKGEEPDYSDYHRLSSYYNITLGLGPLCNEVSNRVQVENTYGELLPEPEPTPTPVPTGSTEPGNGAKDLLSWNYHFGPAGMGMGLIDQVWYTKYINLKGYKGRSISGTLHFELVPDDNAHEEYTVQSSRYNKDRPDDPDNYTKVKVVPGVMKYKYDTPFSSEDFVDPVFNKLVTEARSDFIYNQYEKDRKTPDQVRAEMIKKLFDHAFLHEWGTVRSSQGEMYRVGKVLPSHFENQDDYNEYFKTMGESNLWVNWKNDPEKHVTGYKTYPTDPVDLELEAKADRPLIRKNEIFVRHLATIPSFINGDMRFTSEFVNPYSGQTSYTLYAITRPIAISKTYDAAGNITSIEKPLFPSVPLLDFYAKHNAKVFPDDDSSKSPYKDIDKCDYVFRYKLIERDATGVDITPTDEEIIVEFVYQRGYNTNQASLRMYQNEKKARENRYTYRVKPGEVDPMANETTDRVRLANYLNTPFPKTGDNNTIYLYIALIGIAFITTILVIRKRKTN